MAHTGHRPRARRNLRRRICDIVLCRHVSSVTEDMDLNDSETTIPVQSEGERTTLLNDMSLSGGPQILPNVTIKDTEGVSSDGPQGCTTSCLVTDTPSEVPSEPILLDVERELRLQAEEEDKSAGSAGGISPVSDSSRTPVGLSDAAHDKRGRVVFTLATVTPGNAVDKQRVHRGPYSIPPSMADWTSFRDQNAAMHILTELNEIFGTNYTFKSEPHLEAVLNHCVLSGFDFGMIYGMLRPWWNSPSGFQSIQSTFQKLEEDHRRVREQAVSQKMVTEPMMPPRRVWDLYSNRVLPIWAIETDLDVQLDSFQRIMPLSAVSHAWVFPDDRQNILTTINGKQWPVPLPNGSSLEGLRIELLNLDAEYVWLDVLCLRQRCDQELSDAMAKEEIRIEEWALDVPTIGAVYAKCREVIVYLNGLGRPFQQNDLNSTRHWCNRAWTVQEWCFAASMSLAGVTLQSPEFHFASRDVVANGPEDSFPQQLAKRVQHTRSTSRYVFQGVAEMCRRSAESEVDKIAGLAYNFSSMGFIPAFYEASSAEEAWERLVQSMNPRSLGDLFFLFPIAGQGTFKWMPTWCQILQEAGFLANNDQTLSAELDAKSSPILKLDSTEKTPRFTCTAILLPSCSVRGFDETSSGDLPHWGTVTFSRKDNSAVTFKVAAHHRLRISDGTYALLSNLGHYNSTCRFWVVGTLDTQRGGQRHFSKITVLQMAAEEIEPKAWLFVELDLSTEGNGEDVGNEQSSYVEDVVLA